MVEYIMDSIYELECRLAKNRAVHDFKIHKERVVTKCYDSFFQTGYKFVINVRFLEDDGSVEDIKVSALEIANQIMNKRLYKVIEVDFLDFISNKSIYNKKIGV